MTAPPSLTASNLHSHQLRAAPAPAATTIPLRGRPTHHLSPTGGGAHTQTRVAHTTHTVPHTHTQESWLRPVSRVEVLIVRSTAAHTPAPAAYRSYTYCGAVTEVSIIRVLTHSTDCCRRIPFKRQPS
jgi:hypothetical protein